MLTYLRSSESMDRLHAWLVAIGPRGWLALGMAGVGFSFATGSGSAEALAIATGGVLLGYQALRRFVFGVGQLAGAWQAWETVRDLFDAAAQSDRKRRIEAREWSRGTMCWTHATWRTRFRAGIETC